jgi:hypothetical protein
MNVCKFVMKDNMEILHSIVVRIVILLALLVMDPIIIIASRAHKITFCTTGNAQPIVLWELGKTFLITLVRI